MRSFLAFWRRVGWERKDIPGIMLWAAALLYAGWAICTQQVPTESVTELKVVVALSMGAVVALSAAYNLGFEYYDTERSLWVTVCSTTIIIVFSLFSFIINPFETLAQVAGHVGVVYGILVAQDTYLMQANRLA